LKRHHKQKTVPFVNTRLWCEVRLNERVRINVILKQFLERVCPGFIKIKMNAFKTWARRCFH
jgi:hypothetical protein